MDYLTIGVTIITSFAGVATMIAAFQMMRRDPFEARDAARWRMIDLLRDRHGSVEIWAEINGRPSVDFPRDGRQFVAATIDVALAQALNAEPQS